MTATSLAWGTGRELDTIESEAFLGIAEAAINSAIRMGAELAEAYICNSKELKIEVRESRVETMKLAGNRGMGLRVVRDNRAGFPSARI